MNIMNDTFFSLKKMNFRYAAFPLPFLQLPEAVALFLPCRNFGMFSPFLWRFSFQPHRSE